MWKHFSISVEENRVAFKICDASRFWVIQTPCLLARIKVAHQFRIHIGNLRPYVKKKEDEMMVVQWVTYIIFVA